MKKNPYALAQLQSLPLEQKIILTKARIKTFYAIMKGNVFVSFSGGKDSLVLLTLAREIYPNIKAVFADTGLEYPEIKEFVKTIPNVEIVRPEKSFKKIIIENGYPVISKSVAQAVRERRLSSGGKYAYRKQQFEGTHKIFDYSKYKFLLDAPFKISEKCCTYMKKNPIKVYSKKTGSYPLIATLAEESMLRRQSFFAHGCTILEGRNPRQAPMMFWTEQDVLKFIYENGIKLPSVYGAVKDSPNRQLELFDDSPKYTCTGLKRTGCIFCLFGITFDGEENRILRLKKTHPSIYKYAVKPVEEGGLGLGLVMDYLGIPYE